MIDWFLAVCLILVLPGHAVWKSSRREKAPPNRPRAYLKSGLLIAGLLLLLGYDWWRNARPVTALGLDVPLSRSGEIALIIVAILLVTMVLAFLVHKFRGALPDRPDERKLASANELFPQSRAELFGFLVLALFVGIGWELLYRGFLLWLLVPHVGVVVAVCIAAVAYGAAHGYKSRKRFVMSMVSAFLFTIAFALTGSLWWLMLIHTTMVVVGGISGYRSTSKSAEAVSLSSTEASS